MILTDIFLKIFSMGLTASYCVLFICIARLPLKRAPKIFSYLLWGIVAVRLICPISPESGFSLMGRGLLTFTERIEGNTADNSNTGNGKAYGGANNLAYGDDAGSTGDANSPAYGDDAGSAGDANSPAYGDNAGSAGDANSLAYGNNAGSAGDANNLAYGDNAGSTGGANSPAYGDNAGSTGDANNLAYGDNAGSAGDANSPAYGNGTDSANTVSRKAHGRVVTYGRISYCANDGTGRPYTGGPTGPNAMDGQTYGYGKNVSDTGAAPPAPRAAVTAAAAVVWFTGMLGLLAYCIISYLRLHRRLTRKAVYSLLYRDIRVYEVAGLDTPFVAGFAKPAIYLPKGLEEWEARQCLAHEYTHIRRRDYLIKQGAFLLACVYWFHPLMWLAFHLMSKDMEMSCDEATLRNADLKDRKAYSNTLIRLSSETTRFSGCPLAFSEHDTSSRIKNILILKKPAAGITAVCSILLALLAAGLLTDPSHASEKTESVGTAPEKSGAALTGPAADRTSADGDSANHGDADASPDGQQGAASPDQTTAPPSGTLPENPYPTLLQTYYQDLQAAYRENNEEQATALQQEMRSLMTSYWTELVKEKKRLDQGLRELIDGGSASSDTEQEAVSLTEQRRILQNLIDQSEDEMDYMNKTIRAIKGLCHVAATVDYETEYPLYATLSENNIAVRSMPKESAPQVDTLFAGNTVTIISFGKYMLQEDQNFRDFFLSDEGTLQEYNDFAVVLYRSDKPDNKSICKGYVSIDALDISGNTAETYKYWIGKTWGEAICSRDGAALYRMAADKESFTDWESISGIRGTNPVQAEPDTSNPCPRHFYHVSLLAENATGSPSSPAVWDIALQFFVQTPKPAVWTQRQDLKLAYTPGQLEDIGGIDDLRDQSVFFSDIRDYERITSVSEYQDAYLTDCGTGPSYFDFGPNGYTDLYNANYPVSLNEQSMFSHALKPPDTILENFLNLSGGSAESDIMVLRLRDGDNITGLLQLAYLKYTFANKDENGHDKITVLMYYDENYNWSIWIPGQDKTIDDAIYRMQENMSLSIS